MAMMTLGTVAQYINGRAFKPEEWEESGKPIIRIQNLTNSSDVCNRTTNTYEEKYLVTDGDLLFAWSASLGAHIWHGEDGWLNQHIFKIIPYECIEKMYLYYYLLFVVDQLYAKTHGSGMVHITLKPFKDTPIIVPSIIAQQRIVDRIESLFAKLDEAKEKAQSVVDSFEDRKAAILHKAFTGELTDKWRGKHGINLEGTWKEKTVVDLCSVIVDCPHSTPEWTESGKICLRTTNIKGGYLDLSEIQYVSEQTFLDRIQRAIPQAGDVLLTREGNIGDVGVIPKGIEICLGQRMMLLRPDGCEPNFLVYFFRSPRVTEIIKSNTMGSTAPRMNIKDIKQISMLCPSYEEQKVITCILDSLMQFEQKAKEAAEQVIDQIDTMKKAILARAFRGELGTNDPADESAEELLKRII